MQTGSSHLHLSTGVSTCTFGSRPDVVSDAAASAPVPLLAEYATSWLESLDGLVLPSTVEAYAGRLARHVLPRIGDRLLDAIEVDDIVVLISNLRKQGYSGTTIAATLTPLSRLFSHAVRRGLIQANPVSKLDRTERPRISRQERPVLNPEEIGRLLEAAAPKFRTLLATAILSGLRRGELLGLHWRDIDFENQLIHVRTALNRERQDAPPKTERAVRDVVLMPALADALRQHQNKTRFNESDDYVFTTRTGTPHHAPHIGLRALKPALERAGLPPVRWHDLRHTFASLLIAGGANITFISRQLGHTSSQVTLGIYAHLLDGEEQARRTREMLQSMLGCYLVGDDANRAKPSSDD